MQRLAEVVIGNMDIDALIDSAIACLVSAYTNELGAFDEDWQYYLEEEDDGDQD